MKRILALLALTSTLAACDTTNNYYPTAPDAKPDTAVNLASQSVLVGYQNEHSDLPLVAGNGTQWNTSYWACAWPGIVPLMTFVSSDASIIAILGTDAPVIDPNAPCPLGTVGWSEGLRFTTWRLGDATITRILQANPNQNITTTYTVVPYNP